MALSIAPQKGGSPAAFKGVKHLLDLPPELRWRIWKFLRESTNGLTVCRAMRCDIINQLDLTLEISGKPYWISGGHSERKLGDSTFFSWPSEIGVRHQLARLAPLHPTFFDFRPESVDQSNTLHCTALSLYRTLVIKVNPPRNGHFQEDFLRLYNSLWWIIHLLNSYTSRCLPPGHVVFENMKEHQRWTCYTWRAILRSIYGQPVYDRYHQVNQEGWVEQTDLWLCLRLLRLLRNFERLRITCPDDIESLPGGATFSAECVRIESADFPNTSLEALHEYRLKIQQEIDFRVAFFEMLSERLKGGDLLRRERHAFWCKSYERAAYRRLDNAKHADGTTPAFVELARRKLNENRMVTAMYNPLGREFKYIYSHLWPQIYQEYLRTSVGVTADAVWSPAAWFVPERYPWLTPSIQRYGTSKFQRHRHYCYGLKGFPEDDERVAWEVEDQ